MRAWGHLVDRIEAASGVIYFQVARPAAYVHDGACRAQHWQRRYRGRVLEPPTERYPKRRSRGVQSCDR